MLNKNLDVNVLIRTCLLLVLVQLVACQTTSVKKESAEESPAPTLVDTTQYIPVQKFDEKNSIYEPYQARENPYLLLKGKINKEAVTKYIQARRLYKKKNYTGVEKLLGEIIALDRKLSGPWVMRADLAVQGKDTDSAISHLKKALEVNAKNVNAYIKLAKIQRELGQFIEAQNTYEQALAVWPDFPEAHLNLGILYDIYLNHPLRAQKHMEAYQFLTDGKNKKVAVWLKEVQARTGVKPGLVIPK